MIAFLLRFIIEGIAWLFTLLITGVIFGSIAAILVFHHYSQDLPDYSTLARYDPPTVTRLYAADGRLMAEYATEKRVFVPLTAIPRRVIQAFVAAEDKNFFEHTGVDLTGVARAIYTNVVHYGQNKPLVGGSTITQQVVKNFLLTDEKSFERKIKEAILALRISRTYSKEKILELYLNEIFLGLRSYGVAAAALNYFNKSLDELTIEEVALLAAQPKAPSNYDPRKNYEAARDRRNWVISRMLEDGHITAEEAAVASEAPITLRARDGEEVAKADFFSEEVRRWLSAQYGANALYEGGLVVKTTLEPRMQRIADAALRKTLIDYDRRRGYRGPVARLDSLQDWKTKLAAAAKQGPFVIEGQRLAVVTAVDDKHGRATLGFDDDKSGAIPFGLLKWTRQVVSDGVLGPEIHKVSDVLKEGDVVLVSTASEEQKKSLSALDAKGAYDLQQVPAVNGALVALDPHTGRVLAMSGGYSAGGTEFNRATQAKRQPGSSYKPFVYLAGLESGLLPNTLVLDAPVELSQGEGLPTWKPQNYAEDYLGPTTLRVGLEKSRNTMTVRIAQAIGIDKVLGVGKRMGVYDSPPRNFSIVLGTSETTVLRMAAAYASFVNGGKRVHPALVERVDDRNGRAIFRRDTRTCIGCLLKASVFANPTATVAEVSVVPFPVASGEAMDPKKLQELAPAAGSDLPPIPADDREQVIDPRLAYQMVSMMEGVVQRGTAMRARSLGRPVAGKTGTTNNSMDTWFVGFTPDLVVGVYVGFDRPQTMGKKETGSSVALPGFIEFVKEALEDVPAQPFRTPRGIRLEKIDLKTGQPHSDEPQVMEGGALDGMSDGAPMPAPAPSGPEIWEAFVTGDPLFIPGVTNMPGASSGSSSAGIIPGNMESPGLVTGEPVAVPGADSDVQMMQGSGGEAQPIPPPTGEPVVGTGGLY